MFLILKVLCRQLLAMADLSFEISQNISCWNASHMVPQGKDAWLGFQSALEHALMLSCGCGDCSMLDVGSCTCWIWSRYPPLRSKVSSVHQDSSRESSHWDRIVLSALTYFCQNWELTPARLIMWFSCAVETLFGDFYMALKWCVLSNYA